MPRQKISIKSGLLLNFMLLDMRLNFFCLGSQCLRNAIGDQIQEGSFGIDLLLSKHLYLSVSLSLLTISAD